MYFVELKSGTVVPAYLDNAKCFIHAEDKQTPITPEVVANFSGEYALTKLPGLFIAKMLPQGQDKFVIKDQFTQTDVEVIAVEDGYLINLYAQNTNALLHSYKVK